MIIHIFKTCSVTFCCIVVRLYQLIISPFTVPCCRFRPTCSEYAIDAFRTHGIIKGGIYAVKRLLSCHPWSGKEGFDPVPDTQQHCHYHASRRSHATE